MYYFDKRLQYPVKVESPDPLFARQLQQAIGGVEGEIRVCLQYFFQAWGNRSPTTKYRDMLLNTATEEIGHIEMLAVAVAMNLENAPLTLQETTAHASPLVNAVMGRRRTAPACRRRYAAAPSAFHRAGRFPCQLRRASV